jgi:hypothetical protein
VRRAGGLAALDALLGDDGWRGLIEKELDHYALLRWEPDAGDIASGRFVMLPSLLEFARRKYRDADHAGWEPRWMRGWLETVQTWDGLLSGRSPEELSGTADERAAFGRGSRQLGARLFEATQANWLAATDRFRPMSTRRLARRGCCSADWQNGACWCNVRIASMKIWRRALGP